MPKALVPIGGKPILAHAIETVRSFPHVDGIVITCPSGQEDLFRTTISEFFPSTPDTSAQECPVLWVAGGATRQASVYAGLQAVARYQTERGSRTQERDPIVLIHDAARCFTPPAVFLRVATSVATTGEATIAAVPVTDTLKQVHVDQTHEAAAIVPSPQSNCDSRATAQAETAVKNPVATTRVVRTIDRDAVRAVQTPQGFRLSHIMRLHEEAAAYGVDENSAATDDAGLVEQAGDPVRVVEGSALGLKITTATDVHYATYLLESAREGADAAHTFPK